MAKITILGRGISEDTKKLFQNAALFYAKELMSTRMVNTLKIRIELRKTILNKKLAGVAYRLNKGSYAQKDHHIIIKYNEGNLADMLTTLAHEMVHVKQFSMNELQYRVWKSDKKLHARWKGEEVGVLDSIEYRKRGWEIEAFDMQGSLYKSFLKISKL
jgi:hypothetical protein